MHVANQTVENPSGALPVRGAMGKRGVFPEMAPQRQVTVANTVRCAGIGLHSGRHVALAIRPADPGTGIRFRRIDLHGAGEAAHDTVIRAHIDNVVDARLGSTIGNDAGVTVGTIEHLMAALAGCGVDNALIDIDGAEVPVMDGSAAPFVFLIECAGLVEQWTPRRAIEILRRIAVADGVGGGSAALVPAPSFQVDVEIAFDCAAIGRQGVNVRLRNGAFKREIARARTFGFAEEAERLRAMGLARGASLENAIVLRGDEVLNEDGLRFPDEFARHKALDGVGDLYLAGAPILGRFEGRCSGHALNHALVRAMFADCTAWRWSLPVARARLGVHEQPSDLAARVSA